MISKAIQYFPHKLCRIVGKYKLNFVVRLIPLSFSLFSGVFVNLFFIAYILSPRFCHRFVGYLEEEAVKTYTYCLKVINIIHELSNSRSMHLYSEKSLDKCKIYRLRIIHGHAYIWNFSSSVQLHISHVSAANKWDVKLNSMSTGNDVLFIM